MKNFFIVLALLLTATAMFSQIPQKFNYQAIPRNLSGAPITNAQISLQLSILDGGPNGAALYIEYHNPNTGPLGLINIQIGSGQVVSGAFNAIHWETGNKWLKVEIDPAGGSNFQPLSTLEFQSVPFALFAESARHVTDVSLSELTDVNTGGVESGQVLAWNGSTWVPSTVVGPTYTAGNGINIAGNIISNTGDTDPSNDLVTTSMATGDLSGTFSNLQISPAAVGNAEIADGAINGQKIAQMGASNGQILKWNGSSWMPAVANWGTQFVQTDATLSGTGELSTPLKLAQQGATNGQVLKWNGSSWMPAVANWGTQFVQTDATLSGTGELSTPLKLAQQGATNGQVLKWNGSSWVPAVANWGTQFVQTDATLSGNGLLSTPLKLAQQGASTGQVLKWNGSNWAPQNDIGGGNGDNWGSQVVLTGTALSGNGTFGSPLNIAAQGATSGQTLKWDGNTWGPGNDNTLTLPYAASLAINSQPLFDLSNTGNGEAIKGTTQGNSSNSGVHGISTGIDGTGVKGEANEGIVATGVLGRSQMGYGVYGIGGRYGVYGNGSWAGGYFTSTDGLALSTGNGNVGIGTSVAVGGKMEINSNGSWNNPQLLLREAEADDYTRLGFKNTAFPNSSWTLGATFDHEFTSADKFGLYHNDYLNPVISCSGGGDFDIPQGLRLGKDLDFYSLPALSMNLRLFNEGLFIRQGYNILGFFDNMTGEYSYVSDSIFKQDVNVLDNILPTLKKLRPVTYRFINNDRNSIGFIAQEVDRLFPELVSKVKDEKNGTVNTLNYAGFGVIAIKAIQEQQTQIETLQTNLVALKNENAQLKNQNDALAARLSKLEKIVDAFK